MPRLYTAEEKRLALRLLAKNNGSAKLTCKEIDIPESTLYNWWRERKAMSDADHLRELRQRLIVEALELAIGLKQVSGEAPLNQRATALNQMIDKILKITEVLEEGNGVKEKTEVVVIEYGDEEDEAQIQEDVLETAGDFE